MYQEIKSELFPELQEYRAVAKFQKRMSGRVQCVLFDMDGLLLDTENLYTEGTQSILSEFGHNYDWDFKSKLMGKRTDEVARMIVDHYRLPMTPEQWVERSRDIYQELFPHVKSLKGIQCPVSTSPYLVLC